MVTNEKIDVAIATRVMGWKHDELYPQLFWFCGGEEGHKHKYHWHPSSSISDAWRVLGRMKQLGWLASITQCYNGYVVTGRQYRFETPGDWQKSRLTGQIVQREADDVETAICLFALDAAAKSSA